MTSRPARRLLLAGAAASLLGFMLQSRVARGEEAKPAATTYPWPSAHGGKVPEPPAFLDVTDRRIRDERPPPSPEKLAGLRELEEEASRFIKIGESYRDTILALVKREYARQRIERDQEFSEQIRAEEEKEDAARLDAIERFEHFIEKYPSDPTYTADAMFRLGELYFERDAILAQVNMDAYLAERDRRLDAGQSYDDLKFPEKSFDDTINLYRKLIASFPDYERLDGAYYLIAYCLNEMGKPDEARLAWLNLVCANEYKYEAPKESTDEGDDKKSLEEEHPSLTMDDPKRKSDAPLDDPYGPCKSAVENTKFYAETWLRIGEYHFDLDYSEEGIDYAISAYNKVLLLPEDRNYNLALYKVAWAYYRASRYPEAMAHFAQLVQWSDDEEKRTGRRGSELREEALQYLGIGFAYDDWNENQVPDPSEGLPTGLQRVQDPTLLPQDRPWTSEVYYRLGSVYFDEAKYPEAIEVWKLALSRWPLVPQAPEIQNMIARAYTRHNESEAAAKERSKLGEYLEGSAWWAANMDHPAEQRNAQLLAEEAVVSTAIIQHQQAQQLRRRCVEEQEIALCEEAQKEYALAATAYLQYINAYPNNPQAYELRFNLADAFYWSERYGEAAEQYALVRDSNLDDKFFSLAARMAVEAAKRQVEIEEKSGALKIRTEPPAPQGSPPQVQPIKMPESLERLARAREVYLARVDEAHDKEKVRDAYAYNNTLLLYMYGYWDLARERFYAIYAARCKGEHGDETGQVAWLNLRNIAVALNQSDEVRRLGADLGERACTFSADGKAVAAVDCNKKENADQPMCLAGSDLTNLRYRDAVDIFSRAEAAKGEEQRLLYEQAATELVKAVNDEPDHPQAPLALEKAAIALERTSRFESAARLYQRIVDEVGPRKAESPEEQASLDAILGNAYFRLAFNANRFFDFDRDW